jgi:hypothetical protein
VGYPIIIFELRADMNSRALPCTKAYIRMRNQLQEFFDFSVVVCHSIPALKRQMSLLDKRHILALPKPDYYGSTNTTDQLRDQAKDYRKKLARYGWISVFSFFETFIKHAVEELIEFQGGDEEFANRAEQRDKKFMSGASPAIEIAKQRLRGKRENHKVDRYRKFSKNLIEAGYRFPSELLSAFGVKMLTLKLKSLRSADIPDLLIQGLHMQMSSVDVEKFHNIREIRNKIAHGENVSPSLKNFAEMNEFLRNFAYSVDKHLNEHFFIFEEYI